MDRGEFLSILRESMEGLIPMDEVEKNIQFYRSYFDESGQADREVIEELGDPRLIARTIIDAYKASKGRWLITIQSRREVNIAGSIRGSTVILPIRRAGAAPAGILHGWKKQSAGSWFSSWQSYFLWWQLPLSACLWVMCCRLSCS